MQTHITVLLREAVAYLKLQKNSTVVDATYGAAGHAKEILKSLDKTGTYIGIDVDKTALEVVPENPHRATVHLVNDNFRNLKEILGSLHITEVDAILADLGWRMEQFTDSGKGLSFQFDEPLLMTYGEAKEYSFTAYDIINEWEESVLADIIFGYGEERFARRIAKAIIDARSIQPITSTFELRDVIVEALPRQAQFKRTHPATKTFQAIRIAVNDELQALDSFLQDAFTQLAPGGRIAVITFHSLEDRIVKHYFRSVVNAEQATLVEKKPIAPSPEEVAGNPRARSAKLRVLQKNNNNVEKHVQNKYIKKRL